MSILVVFLTLVYSPIVESCCMPPQWQSFQEVVTGKLFNGSTVPHIFKNYQMMYFDAARQRISFDGTSVSSEGTSTPYFSIQDYRTNTSYDIFNGKCTHGTLDFPFPGNCLPANSSMVRTGYIGSGSEREFVKYYEYSMYGLSVSITVDRNCSFINSIFYGLHKNDYVWGITRYSNLTFGIDNNTVFDIPDICRQSSKLPNAFLDPIEKRGVSDTVLGVWNINV